MEEKNKDNPKYQIIANYVKDLSFEIPSPDCFVDAAQNLGKYETKVDISNKPLKKQQAAGHTKKISLWLTRNSKKML